MEQHPVPQNITQFEFKLVGDMTIKQFGYLAAGCISAFIVYSLNMYPIIKFPLVILLITSGVSFAFVPIQERPLDIWVVNFFRSVYRPTQYFWRKKGNKQPVKIDLSKTDKSGDDLATIPSSIPTPPPTTEKLSQYLGTLPEPSQDLPLPPAPPSQNSPVDKPKITVEEPAQIPATPPPPLKLPVTPNLSAKITTEEPATSVSPVVTSPEEAPVMTVDDLLSEDLNTSPAAVTEATPVPAPSETPSPVISQAMNPTAPTIDDLLQSRNTPPAPLPQATPGVPQPPAPHQENSGAVNPPSGATGTIFTLDELVKMRQSTQNPKESVQEITADNLTFNGKKYNPYVRGRVKVVNKSTQKPRIPDSSFFQITTPNLVTGVVKDQTGQVLPNTIVIIKNSQGVGVRALRTNKVGQFIASTPLENGTYYLELDREGYKFDILEISLEGNIVAPLEISAAV